MTSFIAASMGFVLQVKQGMNLRYGNIWDMPLRCLVCFQIVGNNLLFGIGEFGEAPFSNALYDPTIEVLARKPDTVKSSDLRIQMSSPSQAIQ